MLKFPNIIAFINPRSGGRHGAKLYFKLCIILGNDHVFDLTQGGPEPGLRRYRKHVGLKIIACGGDGTVGWIHSVIDRIRFVEAPTVVPFPLGTGNDMSRVLGWGANYAGEAVIPILQDIEAGIPIKMDRWEVTSEELSVEELAALQLELADSLGKTRAEYSDEEELTDQNQPFGSSGEETDDEEGEEEETGSDTNDAVLAKEDEELGASHIQDAPQDDSVSSGDSSPRASTESDKQKNAEKKEIDAQARDVTTSSPKRAKMKSNGEVVVNTLSTSPTPTEERPKRKGSKRAASPKPTSASTPPPGWIKRKIRFQEPSPHSYHEPVFATDPESGQVVEIAPEQHNLRSVFSQSDSSIPRTIIEADAQASLNQSFDGIVPTEEDSSSSAQTFPHNILDRSSDSPTSPSEDTSSTQTTPSTPKAESPKKDEGGEIREKTENEMPLPASTLSKSDSQVQAPNLPERPAQTKRIPSDTTLTSRGGAHSPSPKRAAASPKIRVNTPSPKASPTPTNRSSPKDDAQATLEPITAQQRGITPPPLPPRPTGSVGTSSPPPLPPRVYASKDSRGEAKILSMNNYFSVGVDSMVALEFHNARESSPALFPHHIVNKAWYGIFGLKRAMINLSKKPDLRRILRLELDGVVVPIPKKVEALVFLQIPSYSSGTNLWGSSSKTKGQKAAPTIGDGLFEVVGLKGVMHLGALQAGWSSGIRIGQAHHAVIYNSDVIPVQCDGEPWWLSPCKTVIEFRNQSNMLFNIAKSKHKRFKCVTGYSPPPSRYPTMEEMMSGIPALDTKDRGPDLPSPPSSPSPLTDPAILGQSSSSSQISGSPNPTPPNLAKTKSKSATSFNPTSQVTAPSQSSSGDQPPSVNQVGSLNRSTSAIPSDTFVFGSPADLRMHIRGTSSAALSRSHDDLPSRVLMSRKSISPGNIQRPRTPTSEATAPELPPRPQRQ